MAGSRFVRFALCASAVIVGAGAGEAATLQVAWDPSPDSAVVGYRVSIGTQSGVYTAQVDAGSQTSEQFSSLVGGTKYYFVVQAYDSTGNLSAPSSEVAGVAPLSSPLAITCPAPSATSADGAAVAVAFSTVISGGVAPITAKCSPASGSLFPVGVTPVLCTATDAVSTVASCATTVTVISAAPPPPTSPTPPPPSPTQVDIVGSISGLTGKCPALTFRLNNTAVTTTKSTTYARKSCSSLPSARQIEVKGTVQTNGTVVAQSISVLR